MHNNTKGDIAMTFHITQTDKAPAAIGPYSQAVCAGPLVFVSGQLGMLPETGRLVESGFEDQVRQALDNLKAVLQASGCGLDRVMAVDVFLTDMENFMPFNKIYETYFTDHRPARAVVAVRALPKEAQVEIKCTAYKNDSMETSSR